VKEDRPVTDAWSGVRRWAGRAASVLGFAGSAGHLALAGEHARHSPVLTAGMLLLAVVCARCSVHLWRRPGDPVAWRDLLVLAVVMTAMHLAAGATRGLAAAFLVVPALQAALAVLSVVAGRGNSFRVIRGSTLRGDRPRTSEMNPAGSSRNGRDRPA
jgi:hypothetical protein